MEKAVLWQSRRAVLGAGSALLVAGLAGCAEAAARPALPAVLAQASGDADLAPPPNIADDDGNDILPGDKLLLIVENDLGCARMLLQAARSNGFKGLVTGRGAAPGASGFER